MATLDEFLKSFPAYEHGIDRIRDDFIQCGYERFLWRDSVIERACMESTLKKVESCPHSINPIIYRFMEQFRQNGIVYMFPKRNAATYYMIKEICKAADKVCIIDNLFPDDETENYIAVFNRNDFENITMMNHLTYFGYMSDVFGGYKLFNNSLTYYADFCADGKEEYILKRPNDIMFFMNFTVRHDTNPYIIYDVRKSIEYIVGKYYANEFEFYLDLNYTLLPFLQNLYNEGIEIENTAPIKFDWKYKKESIKKQLIIDGVINSKWKNEQSLYLLVQKEYPDAIYQFRPKWLSPQSLDIYIPSINTAIEYQGIQHYQSIDFFGGEEEYKKRIILDNRKRMLCSENNIRLVEWNYNYDINKANIEKFLQF